MNGFLDADDHQAAKHGYRQLAEHLGLFQQCCRDAGLPDNTISELVQMFFEHLMSGLRDAEQRKSMESLNEMMGEMFRRALGDDDE